MSNPFHSGFAAVFQAEVLLNSKRVAPYVLILLFTAHATLWWGWSAAATFGWAINSDYNIVRNIQGFSFLLGLPVFNAVIMCDPVIRDFRIGIDPLIFSKPIRRASYLLGKFFGNFFVLICCQSAYALTSMLLQWVPLSRLVVHQFRIWPYFKHFLFFVVVSHLMLAVIYFAVGTLTRNSKVVYGLAVGFYPIYIAWQIFFLRALPERWQTMLDPMLVGPGHVPREKWSDAAFINQIVFTYSSEMIVNRALLIAASGFGLTMLCWYFSIERRSRSEAPLTLLDISATNESIYYNAHDLATTLSSLPLSIPSPSRVTSPAVPIPAVARVNEGIRPNVRKLCATIQIELHLLRTERSLIVIVPLTVILSFLSLPFSPGISQGSHSAAFATSSAQGLLVFLVGIVVFYSGESMNREQEIRVGSILWSTPASSNVFLLSKFLATMLLMLFLLLLMAGTAILTQVLRAQTPIDFSPYVLAYSTILFPGLAFVTAASMAINVLLREKYLAYAVSIGISAGLFYLYTQGHNHWLYNPLLWGLWTERDLVEIPWTLIGPRIYCVTLTLIWLLLVRLFWTRR